MIKTDNRFVISLNLGHVLHHCNAKKLLIHSHEVTEYVRLRGDRIKEISFDQPQHGTNGNVIILQLFPEADLGLLQHPRWSAL